MSFRFFWFIAVKSRDMHDGSPLIPPKYKLNACRTISLLPEKQKKTDLVISPSCTTRKLALNSKKYLKILFFF